MAARALIQDGSGNGHQAYVTTRGQLVVAPLEFDQTSTVTMSSIDTAYNLYEPVANKRFVITSILLYADRSVSANDASVQIYEATSASTTTVSSTIIDFEIPKNGNRDITGLNLLTSQGIWINGKTNDNNVYCTVMGYYIEA